MIWRTAGVGALRAAAEPRELLVETKKRIFAA